MRLFELHRAVDPTGTSGTGVVAQGCEFDDGTAILPWLTAKTSTAWYASVEDVVAIHGHNGATVVVFAPADVAAEPDTDQTEADTLLALPIDPDDCGGATTVREFLAHILRRTWA